MNPLSQIGSVTTSISITIALLLASSGSDLQAQSACAPPPSGLVSWWQAESNALDLVGSNNGQLQTGASYATGEVGTAFSFDGVSSKIDLGDPESLAFTNSFSIEGWIWVGGLPLVTQGHGQILYRGDPRYCLDPYYFCVQVNGNLRFHIEDAQNTVPCGVDLETGPIALQAWKHVAATFDGSAGAMQIYINGELAAQTNTAIRPFQNLIDGGTAIGNLSVGQNGQSLNGLIDELSVYNRALTAAEIVAIYSSGGVGKCSVPTAPIFTIQPTSESVTVGDQAGFSASASGTSPLRYQWQFNGTNIGGATDSTLVITNVELANAGTYSVIASNSVGSTNSSGAALTVNPPPSCAPLPAGLVGWWRGEGDATDSIGSDNGSFVNGVGFVRGEVGLAFNFTNISSGVNLGNPVEFQIQDFTLEVWIKRASATRSSSDIWGGAHVLGGTWGGYGMGLNDRGNIFLSKIGYSNVYSTNSVTDTNIFHHVVVTKSGSTVRFYIDGVSETAPSYDPGFVFNGTFAIGARGGDYVSTFFGAVDEASIYNRALTAPEVQALYEAAGSGKCTSSSAPTIFTQPTNQSAVLGASVSFSVAAGGSVPLSYQWEKDGGILNGATASDLIISNINLGDAGSYSVIVSNLVGTTVSSNATLAINPPAPCQPPPSGLVGWWKADGDASDSIGGNSGTPQNGVSFVLGEVGQSFGFNGLDQFVAIPDSPVLDPTNALTLETWVYVSGYPNTDLATIITKFNPSVAQLNQYQLETHNLGGQLHFRPVILLPSGYGDVDGNTAIQFNTWYHVAMTYDGSFLKLYVNGALDGSVAASGSIAPTSEPLRIGGPGSGPWWFNGRVDEVSLYDRALSLAELQAIYHAGAAGKCSSLSVCQPPPAGLVSWWRGEGDASDSFGTNDGSLLNGVGFVPGKVGRAFDFTSVSSGVALGNPTNLQLQDFTLEVWIKRGSATRSSWDIYGIAHVLGGTWGGYGIGLNDAGNIFLSKIGYSNVFSTNSVIDTNSFHHVVVTKTNTMVTFYIDGVAEAAPAYDPGFVFNGTFAIGARGGDYVATFLGAVDEASIYNRALTAQEVEELYGAGAAGKCVGLNTSSACLPPPSAMVGWWKGDNNAADSISANNGSLQNGASFAAGEVQQSFVFNGVNQFVEIPDAPSLDPTNALTVETWVYIVGNPNTDLATIVTKQSPVAQLLQYQLETHYVGGRLDFRPLILLPTGYAYVDGNTALQFNIWYHVAMTYDGSALKLYLNGALDGSVAASGSIAPTTEPLRIGGAGGGPWYFNGRVDEVSLYDRALSLAEIQAIYNAGAAGKCAAQVAPFFEIAPQSQSVTVGASVTLAAIAGGSPDLSYQWQFNGASIPGATADSLLFSSVTLSNAGSYELVVTNVAGSITSNPAILTVTLPPASVQAASATAASDGTVTVPVNLDANGNENGVSFTLNFDPTLLTNIGIDLGSGASGASLVPNLSRAAVGQVGVAIAMPAGKTFSSGTQQVVVVRFSSPPITRAASTTITFGGTPVTNLLVDVAGNPLAATFVSGTVGLPPSQIEGDAYPRPDGDQALTVSDWVLIGRYVAGLDSPTNALEFQKADCAPRDTLGDGSLTVSDWVQAGRYAAGLDPATRVGGPTTAVPAVVATPSIARKMESNLRQVRANSCALAQGQTGTVQVDLVAQGNENALAFSLSFDPTQLAFVGATAGTAANGAVLNVNANQAAQGRLGCVLALKANESFAAGSKQVIALAFRPTALAGGTTVVSFGDQPVVREVSDPNAVPLAADYVNGAVVVTPLPSLNIITAGKSIGLSWSSTASGFVLQESSDATLGAASWTAVTATPAVVNNQSVVSIPVGTSKKFYRLYRP